jgi:hypothetical protein
MKRFSRKPIRVILTSLLLLLILTMALFSVQALAASQESARAPDLATNQQIAAITGGEQLLLEETETLIYLPTIYK